MGRMLDNIQEAMFEIRSLMQSDSDIRKLVYYDTKDALSQPVIDFITPVDHFTMSAIFDVTEAPFDKNTIISSVLQLGSYDEEAVMMRGVVKINVLVRSELWELDNNKIRPMEISNLIIRALNNKKVSSSHKVVFSDMELVILDQSMNGYSLMFFLEEGSGFSGGF